MTIITVINSSLLTVAPPVVAYLALEMPKKEGAWPAVTYSATVYLMI